MCGKQKLPVTIYPCACTWGLRKIKAMENNHDTAWIKHLLRLLRIASWEYGKSSIFREICYELCFIQSIFKLEEMSLTIGSTLASVVRSSHWKIHIFTLRNEMLKSFFFSFYSQNLRFNLVAQIDWLHLKLSLYIKRKKFNWIMKNVFWRFSKQCQITIKWSKIPKVCDFSKTLIKMGQFIKMCRRKRRRNKKPPFNSQNHILALPHSIALPHSMMHALRSIHLLCYSS